MLNANASYVDRRQFFTTRTVNGSWGYEWTKGNKSFLYRPINIEYTQLDKTDSFNNYLASYPSLNLAFRSGLVLSQQFVRKQVWKHDNHSDFLTLSGESSGALFGLIKKLDEGAALAFRTKGGGLPASYRLSANAAGLPRCRRCRAEAYAAGKGMVGNRPCRSGCAFFAGGP